MGGNFLVPVAMFGVVPLVIVLFSLLRPHRAVMAAYIFGWLFLPMAQYDLPGAPPWNKASAIAFSVLFGMVLFDTRAFGRFKFRWLDVPMAVWLLCPLASSISNGLGAYDGASEVLDQLLVWGVPYALGRVYFNSAQRLRELAIWLFMAGVIYAPFCAWELRMSPRLHQTFYGFRQHVFAQAGRGEGWRPMVFMQHGLAVAIFMASASVLGVWVWASKAAREIRGIPVSFLVVPLVLISVMLKSMLAFLLIGVGVGVVLMTPRMRIRALAVALLFFPVVYMGVRGSGVWSGEQLLKVAETLGSEQRAASLQTRLVSEEYLLEHGKDRPLLGWGGHGRAVVSRDGKGLRVRVGDVDVAVIPDGFWVITFARRGVVGLLAITLALLLPALAVIRRLSPRDWKSPMVGAAAALAVMVGLHAVDNLMNAMRSPLYVIAVGALTTCVYGLRRRPTHPRPKGAP